MAMVITDRITKTPGIHGGKACVAGHRIRVMDIVIWHEDLSMSPDEIVAAYPELTLSDIHAALAYYFDNVPEIRNDIRNNEYVADGACVVGRGSSPTIKEGSATRHSIKQVSIQSSKRGSSSP